MKKLSLFLITIFSVFFLSACPIVEPDLWEKGFSNIPEWVKAVDTSDTFTVDENIKKYFNVLDTEAKIYREYTDKDGDCHIKINTWHDNTFGFNVTNITSLDLYFGSTDKLINANYIGIGETYDPDEVEVHISEKDGIFEFDCNSPEDGISEWYIKYTAEEKIKHMKFEKLDYGYNLYLTVDGKEIGPYHFTRAKSVDVAK